MENNKNYYKNILIDYPENIPSPSDSEIAKDLDRTFPNEEFFKKKEVTKSIHNILIAYSRRNSNVGYCQGFCFIVGRLFKILKNEVMFIYIFNYIYRKKHFGYLHR